MGTNSVLGEKLALLAQSFYNDPMTFVNYYHTLYDDHTIPDKYGFDKTSREFYSSCLLSGQQISVGEFNNSNDNNRFIFEPFQNNIFSFSPNPDAGISQLITLENVMVEKISFNLDDELYQSEEGMFQCSLVLSNEAYETLEVFVYLKKYCRIPFKMNLNLFDLDEALSLYV